MLLIVGVASVAKCLQQNHQISLSWGAVLSQSTFHLVFYVPVLLQFASNLEIVIPIMPFNNRNLNSVRLCGKYIFRLDVRC